MVFVYCVIKVLLIYFYSYLLFHRRRAADHVLDDKNLSVSSHDGGDEYSSEASELDSTKNVRRVHVVTRVGRAQLYRLSLVDTHSVAQNTGK